MVEWKPVKDFEGLYWVSSNGEVGNKKRLLKPCRGNHRYESIFLCKGGERYPMLLHRLVASIFIDNPDRKPEVNHKDFDRCNNRADNLEWVTRKENVNHSAMAWRQGQKLSEIDVYDIRWLHGMGANISQLAREYEVSRPAIKGVITGRTYSYV